MRTKKKINALHKKERELWEKLPSPALLRPASLPVWADFTTVIKALIITERSQGTQRDHQMLSDYSTVFYTLPRICQGYKNKENKPQIPCK